MVKKVSRADETRWKMLWQLLQIMEAILLKLFFGIFDGHSGVRCANFMAKELPDKLLQHPEFKTNPSLALHEVFLDLDKQWLSKAAEGDIKDGSTAVVAVLRGEQLYVANLGDSRAVICEAGLAMPLSVDHKPENLLEKNRIERNGGAVFLGRVMGQLAVARSFGDLEFKDRDTFSEKWLSAVPDIKLKSIKKETEFLVLGCDGLFDKLSNDEVVNFVREKIQLGYENIASVCDKLVVHAYDRGSTDNISCIIVSFQKGKKPRGPFYNNEEEVFRQQHMHKKSLGSQPHATKNNDTVSNNISDNSNVHKNTDKKDDNPNGNLPS